ncbi:MAG: hypothetical protein C0619_01490 [Desulfuromonas sp.]|nr:MAG: hypothetical protein C0619_01490 [Desulfuromonas sp.]
MKQLRFFIFFLLFVFTPHLWAAGTNSPWPDEAVPSLLPDTGGQIKTAVLSVNSARKATLRNASLITNIVNSLPNRIKIYIITNDPGAFLVPRNPWPDRIKFIHLPGDNPITIWTQDPFLVLAQPGKPTTLLPSNEFNRAGDRLMASAVAEKLGFTLKRSPLDFEGGNIVADDNFAFIGADTIRHNAIVKNTDEVEIVRQFENELNRKVLVIGPFPQPIGHIDMMITPIGDKRVVVADSRAGAELAEEALNKTPETVRAFESYCENYFFGSPKIDELTTESGEKINRPKVVGQTLKMIDLSNKIAPVLDGIAGSLENFGYTVFRIPFLYGVPAKGTSESDNLKNESYPMITYNNVVMERDGHEKIVYLPSYRWEMMDQKAAKAWSDLGFTVHQVEGLAISSMYGGSLRCSVKVLERI